MHSNSQRQAQSLERIVVGVSGGVDSSVATLLLREQGRDVHGMFMKNWDEDDDEQCSATEDLRDATAVCDALGVPLHTRNFSSEYWDQVFNHCLNEFRAGRTPNPDVLCNREIKFKVFLEHARALGGQRIATGHYARVAYLNGRYVLLKARDTEKDQSYFLHLLGQDALSATLFPLGELSKPQVRALAHARGLTTYAKKDSTGICFIGERKFKDFLARYLPAQPGEIITTDGKGIGTHDGLMYYTLGQRKGINIGGRRDATPEPWYVVAKNLADNALIVAQGEHHPMLYSQTLIAEQVHWIRGSAPHFPVHCAAKTRYRQPDQACTIESAADGTHRVRFTHAQRAVTPGQSVVFYDDDECLGGGIIRSTERNMS